jgi:hypothetical protein
MIVIMMLATFVIGLRAEEPVSGTYVIRAFDDLKGYQEADFDHAAKAYLGSLDYDGCPEIVEGGLAQLTMMKLAQPGSNQRAIVRKLNDLAVQGETPAIRFKAYLASMVFSNAELFPSEKFGRYSSGDELFAAIASRLQKATLAFK